MKDNRHAKVRSGHAVCSERLFSFRSDEYPFCAMVLKKMQDITKMFFFLAERSVEMLSAFSGFLCFNNMVKENSLVPFKQDSTVTQKHTCDPKAFCKSYFTRLT